MHTSGDAAAVGVLDYGAECGVDAGGKQPVGGGGGRTREDLLALLRGARNLQRMDADALTMFQGILETAETQVRDIMVPRAQMTFVERVWPLEKLVREVVESGHSRFPVTGESRDEIVGILLAKALLRLQAPGVASFDIAPWLLPAPFVPAANRVNAPPQECKHGRNPKTPLRHRHTARAGAVRRAARNCPSPRIFRRWCSTHACSWRPTKSPCSKAACPNCSAACDCVRVIACSAPRL